MQQLSYECNCSNSPMCLKENISYFEAQEKIPRQQTKQLT